MTDTITQGDGNPNGIPPSAGAIGTGAADPAAPADAGGEGQLNQYDQSTLQQAMDQTNQELGAAQKAQIDYDYQQEPGLEKVLDDTIGPIAAGSTNAFFQTKDFFTGGTPKEEEKWPLRRWMEEQNRLNASNPVNNIAQGVTSFGVGLLGAGKLMDAVRLPSMAEALFGASKTLSATLFAGKSAVTAAAVFDPHQGRLSNMIQSNPSLANPVNGFLAADPNDSDAAGRLKNALEDLGLSAVSSAVLGQGLRLYKLTRAGADTKAVADASAAVEKALQDEAKANQAAANIKSGGSGQYGDGSLESVVPDSSTGPRQPTPVPQPFGKPYGDGTVENIMPGNKPATGAEVPTPVPQPFEGGKPGLTVEDEGAAHQTESPEPPPFVENDENAQQNEYAGSPPSAVPPDGAGKVSAGGSEGPSVAPPVSPTQAPPARPITMGDIAAKMSAAPSKTMSADEGAPGRGASISEPPEAVTAAKSATQQAPGITGVKQAIPPVPTAKVKALPEIDLTAAPGVVAKIGRDVDNLIKYGSRENAVANGVKFGGDDVLPWQTWNTPEDVTATAQRIADHFETELKAVKGDAIPDKRINTMAIQRMKAFGIDPEATLGMIRATAARARAPMIADMEASNMLAWKMTDEGLQTVRKIVNGNLSDWGGSASDAMADFGKRMGLAFEFMANSSEIASGQGRGLRRVRGDINRPSFKIIQKLKALPVEDLFNLFKQTDGDVGEALDILNRPSLLATVTDYLSFLRVNNLLWKPATHIVNTVTNAYMIATRPLERIIGATIARGINKVTGGKLLPAFDMNGATATRVGATRELTYLGSGLVSAAQTAMKTLITGDSILAPHTVELRQAAGQRMSNTGGALASFRSVKGIGDLFYNALSGGMMAMGLPTRLLGVLDEGAKVLVYHSVVMSKASMEADALGLKGPAAKTYMLQKIRDSLDENGAATDMDALHEAQVRTWNNQLMPGTIGNSVQNFKAVHPWVNFIIPFVKTPTNVFRYAWKLTPALNLVQTEYREAIMGVRGATEQASAIGQMSLGALYMGMAAYLVHSGMFTGSGPADAGAKKTLLDAGWQPNSVVTVNSDGTTHYFPLGRFDPVAMPFGIMADLQDAANAGGQNVDIGNATAALFWSVVSQMRSRTYLLGVTQFLDAVNSPGTYGEKANRYMGNLAGSLVPGASLWQATNADPYLRDARGLADGVVANTPGLQSSLPAQYDWAGEPVRARHVALGSNTNDSLVDSEIIRMGLDGGDTPVPPNPSGTKGGDLRDITLEDGRNAYEEYQQLSGRPPGSPMSLKDKVAEVIKSPLYQAAIDGKTETPGTRQYLINQTVKQYRKAALNSIAAKSPIFRQKQAEAELLARSALKNVRPVAASGAAAGLSKLGQDYGLDLGIIQPTLDKLTGGGPTNGVSTP